MHLVFSAVLGAAIFCGGFLTPAMAGGPPEPGLWSVGVTGGTLGVGAEVAFRVYEPFVVRVSGSYLGVNSSWVVPSSQANSYNFTATGVFVGPILDYHPFGNGWRASVGLRYVDIEIKGVTSSAVKFNGVEYGAAEIGRATATVRNSNNAAPYLGFGYDALVYSGAGWGCNLGFDIGALYIGEPDVTITTSIPVTSPTLAADIASATASIKNSVRDYSFYPVAMASARFSF